MNADSKFIARRPLLFAHRGASAYAMENSMAAFELAVEQRADGIELDVRLTRDGQVVVFHDASLARLTGIRMPVEQKTMHELRSIPLRHASGKNKKAKFETAFIPSLEDVCALLSETDIELNIELKGDVSSRRELAKQVSKVFAELSPGRKQKTFVSSFHPDILIWMRLLEPRCKVAFLFDRRHTGLFRARVGTTFLMPDFVNPHAPLVTPKRMERWRAQGLLVQPYTVNQSFEALRLARLGVRALITDDVPRIRLALEVLRDS